MGCILKVGVRPESDDQRGKEAKILGADAEIGLFVVKDRQQVNLSHGLRVDQPPEVADHPHGGGFEYLVLSGENASIVDLALVEVRLEDNVIIVHEVIPEKRRHQELDPDAENNQERFLVKTPQILKAFSTAGGGAYGGWEVKFSVLVSQTAVFTTKRTNNR